MQFCTRWKNIVARVYSVVEIEDELIRDRLNKTTASTKHVAIVCKRTPPRTPNRQGWNTSQPKQQQSHPEQSWSRGLHGDKLHGAGWAVLWAVIKAWGPGRMYTSGAD